MLSRRFLYSVPVFSYKKHQARFINCIMTAPDCGLPKGTKLSNFMNYCLCSAHFSKGKMLYFQLKICVFPDSTCIHNAIIRVCIIIFS